jgi:hypothetical protein
MNVISQSKPEAVGQVATMLRTYLAITFWGEEYRRYFLDFCLASLMAPKNIPAIKNKLDARFLIATTQADWDAMQSEPIFMAANEHIRFEHLPHAVPDKTTNANKMKVMSEGHKLLAQRMFADRAHGIFLYPDIVIADGAVMRIEELAREGYKVVLCIMVRFSSEALIAALRADGVAERGRPIVIDALTLARMSLEHLHSETIRLEFESEITDQGACSFFWVVNPGRDVLFQCTNWAPILIDYSSLHHHDDSTFDEWTLDGDYVAKNFAKADDYYVVRDTSELFIGSFNDEAKVSSPRTKFWLYRFGPLRRALKAARARENMDAQHVLDEAKREFFRIPIRVRGGNATESEWTLAERQGAKLVKDVLEPNLVLRSMSLAIGQMRKCVIGYRYLKTKYAASRR